MPDPTGPPKVLIVDDDQGLLRLMERVLQREGFITAKAGSGKDAVDWLMRNSASLMLLDLKLPDTSGKDLIDHLASAGRLVPFIIITGQGDERVAVQMMKQGALDYLVKDVQFIEFIPTVVQRCLDQLAKEKRLSETEEELRRSEALLAQAQELAHVGSYEISQPEVLIGQSRPFGFSVWILPGRDWASVNTFRITFIPKITQVSKKLWRRLSAKASRLIWNIVSCGLTGRSVMFITSSNR